MTHPGPARTIKIVLEYDGTGLAGWQRQAHVPTIQEHVENALSRLTGERVTVMGAGRTDAGVHALGQAAHFRTHSTRTLDQIVRGGNALLPKQIAIRSATGARSDFHARYHALSKTYRYTLLVRPVRSTLERSRVWHLSGPLDRSNMARALDLLQGTHDFAAFQSSGTEVKTTVRELISVALTAEDQGFWNITLTGTGFLRHMVRSIVGTLVLVGQNRMEPEHINNIIAGKDRGRAGPTAPAQGLCLMEVRYDPGWFDPGEAHEPTG